MLLYIIIVLTVVIIIMSSKMKEYETQMNYYRNREREYQYKMAQPPNDRDCKIWYYRNQMNTAVRNSLGNNGRIKTWKWLRDYDDAFELCDSWIGYKEILVTYMDNAEVVATFRIDGNNAVLDSVNWTKVTG